MRIESEPKFDFDDVLIRPKRSIAPSRASIELKREYRFQTTPSGQGWAGIPIIASNFDTVGTMRMAAALHDLNMLTCLHKYYPLEELIDFFTKSPGKGLHLLHARHSGRGLRQVQDVLREVRRLGRVDLR